MSTSLLFLLLLVFNDGFFFQVHAFFSNNSPNAAQFELIHRHALQLSQKNRLEGIKELIHSDNGRQQMISHRLGLRRRKTWEVGRGDLIKIPMRSGADMGTGEYLVSFRVGSPPKKFVLIADTGSDLTWMNCNYRCNNCRQHPGRIFHANQSPTFKTVPCSSHVCKVDLLDYFTLSRCPTPATPCAFQYEYADGTSATGFFAYERVTVGLGNLKKIKLDDVLIGCSESFDGTFHEVDGIMGLGYSKHSFAIKAAEKFGNKFSYCLVDHFSPSNLVNYLTFGNATSSSPNMQYTELVLGVLSSFYAVNVVGVSIGGVMMKIPFEVWDVGVRGSGGVILDSGSTLTFLTEPAYKPIMAALKAPLMKFKQVELHLGQMEFCFKATGFEESSIPKLAFHFADGVQFVPPVKNYVIDVADGVKCLGFASSYWPGTSVIGNIMQQNHLWEFDLARNKLGFAPSTCASL